MGQKLCRPAAPADEIPRPWNTAQRAHGGAKFRPLLNAEDLGIRTAGADIGIASVYKRSFTDVYML
jgi:hypothetical protein